MTINKIIVIIVTIVIILKNNTGKYSYNFKLHTYVQICSKNLNYTYFFV